jgi:hypothetical protein
MYYKFYEDGTTFEESVPMSRKEAEEYVNSRGQFAPDDMESVSEFLDMVHDNPTKKFAVNSFACIYWSPV